MVRLIQILEDTFINLDSLIALKTPKQSTRTVNEISQYELEFIYETKSYSVFFDSKEKRFDFINQLDNL